MRHSGNDAVAVRQFGLRRVVGFHHSGNYEATSGFNTLSNSNVQQLYLDGVRWAAGGIALPADPPLRFSASLLPGGELKLLLGTTDGSPITLNRSARIQFYWSTNPSLPMSNWVQMTSSAVLTNGLLRLDGLSYINSSQRFFRAMETP